MEWVNAIALLSLAAACMWIGYLEGRSRRD